MRRLFSAFVIAVVAAAWMTDASAQQTTLRAAAETAAKQFAAGLQKKDAAAVAALYTTNAIAFPPNADAVSGRAAIQKLWGGVMASGVNDASLTITEVEEHGDTGFETGTFVMRAGGKQVDQGKYIVVWKKEQGQWKLHRDIWNSSVPIAPPAK